MPLVISNIFFLTTTIICLSDTSKPSYLERLASTDWEELVSVSLEVSKELGLKDFATRLTEPSIIENPANLDFFYSEDIFKDRNNKPKKLIYLGNSFILESLIPLKNTEDINDFRNHQGLWLMSFKVNTNAGQTRHNPEDFRKDDQTSPPMSAKLKANLLRAKQIRNILKFDGFLKLKLPPDRGLKQISDVVYLNEHFFVLDKLDGKVIKFDNEGNFIKVICRQGNGPGECDGPIYLNKVFENQLALSDRKGLLVYDSKGKFIRRIDGFQRNNSWLDGSQFIWADQDRILLANPFRKIDERQQFGLVQLKNGHIARVVDFGRPSKFSNSPSNSKFNLKWTAFAKVGKRLWVGSPFQAVIELYDLRGNFITELEDSRHINGVTMKDFEELAPNDLGKFYLDWQNPKLRNWSIDPLGPLVIRTMACSDGNFYYDIFDWQGILLAKKLKSGASSIEILGTYENHLVGKIPIFDHLELTEETLSRTLYKPEYDALLKAGFNFGEDEGPYLWLAHLP